MALQTTTTWRLGKSPLEGLYSAGESVGTSSGLGGLVNYTATKPVDISPILEEAMVYDYKFLTGTDTRPYQFWNTGMTQTHAKMVFDKVHSWYEDTLYPNGEEVDTEALVNSLATGVEKGWITDEEAKTEYRQAFNTVRAADYKAQQKAQQIENLKKALAEAEGSEAGE